MRSARKPLFKSKPKYAIVVDGKCEFWYLTMLKRNEQGIPVDLKPEIPQKKSLKEQYDRVIKLADDYDKVFWIIDYDVVIAETRRTPKGNETPERQLKKYIEIINQKYKDRIVVIINNPCLEYWLLLHFEETNAPFTNCNEVGKRLKKHLPAYEKSQTFYTKEHKDIYRQLKPNLSKAVASAIKLNEPAVVNYEASFSQMYLLFQECLAKE